MTREEIADKLEGLAKGIREGKTLQGQSGEWWNIEEHEIEKELNLSKLRIAPEKKYVPFTADDWREFSCKSIIIYGSTLTISSWDKTGVRLIDPDGKATGRFIAYDYALSIGVVFAVTGKPFGKQVQP